VAQKRSTGGQCPLQPTRNLQARRVARVRALAGHWLGTGNVGVKKDQLFLPFKEALLQARSLKLKGQNEWTAWCKSSARPNNVPSTPQRTYKHNGWQGYGHWLGTGNIVGGKRQEFLPFKKALLYARALKLKTVKEWETWRITGSRPANIPSTPQVVYKHDGWQGYGHWLGTGNVATKDQRFLPFKKALVYARSLKLEGKEDWKAWCKSGARPNNVPSNPQQTYTHDGWQGYGHWLGTGNQVGGKLDFLPFKTALLYARSLKLTCQKEWTVWSMSSVRPVNIPSAPHATYKHDGWQGYGHWLGTGKVGVKKD
jgi:hypothetical protein